MLLEMTGGGEPAPTRFQVLGERSSGTNYVSLLLKRNLALAPSEALGWKHGFPHMLAVPADMLVVGVVRHPVAWVRSMFAKPWHASAELQALDFSGFLRAPWDSRIDRADYFGLEKGAAELGAVLQLDRHPLTGEMFGNVLQLRTAKLAALTGMAARCDRLVLVAFEKVLAGPEDFVAALAEHYGVARAPEFRPIGRRLGQKFRAAVSTRPDLPDEMSAADKAFLWDELDAALEARVGYIR